LDFFPVDIQIELWYLRPVGCKDSGQAGLGISSRYHHIRGLLERVQSSISSIFYFELEPPGVS
jgi:hypothetical protein